MYGWVWHNKILIIWLDGELGLICEFVSVVSKGLVIYIVHSRTFFFFFFFEKQKKEKRKKYYTNIIPYVTFIN